jgi:hypothetical protein
MRLPISISSASSFPTTTSSELRADRHANFLKICLLLQKLNEALRCACHSFDWIATVPSYYFHHVPVRACFGLRRNSKGATGEHREGDELSPHQPELEKHFLPQHLWFQRVDLRSEISNLRSNAFV